MIAELSAPVSEHSEEMEDFWEITFIFFNSRSD